jgi:adenylate kinase family enzyme
MKDLEFPLFKTKTEDSETFDLTNPEDRSSYFQLKAGEEIKKIRKYLKEGNSFIAYLLGPKSSGKGTYAKMFKEIIDPGDRIEHFSVGDMVRRFDRVIEDEEKKKEFIAFLKENYRGFVPLEEIISSLENRSTETLLPTELILALIKKEIARKSKKALFIDGFPRNLDQISYSLFFRDLVEYREDPDIFVLINVPESVIDERIKYRVICPLCQTSRNSKLLPTKKVKYDKKEDKFYLLCDNPDCSGARMVRKEGDEKGIELIRKRIETDRDLIKKAFSLHGIPKVLLRNSVPVDKAEEYIDNYEITPAYSYERGEGEQVEVKEDPWQIKDDKGKDSYSLMPPPVLVSLIKQLSGVLGL